MLVKKICSKSIFGKPNFNLFCQISSQPFFKQTPFSALRISIKRDSSVILVPASKCVATIFKFRKTIFQFLFTNLTVENLMIVSKIVERIAAEIRSCFNRFAVQPIRGACFKTNGLPLGCKKNYFKYKISFFSTSSKFMSYLKLSKLKK